ncbi:MAG: hypothetical protein QM658_00810 [Gordonia sp. (in: high G+C Gram-positive bacteria)]
MTDRDPQFSLGKTVAYSLGAAVLVLAVATVIVWFVAGHSPVAALIVALGAVIAMVVAIAMVSKRMLRDVQRRIDELESES